MCLRFICFATWLFCSNFAFALRNFPAGTIFGSIQAINYPQITLQQVPSNWFTSMLGMILLPSQNLVMSPASIIRNQSNVTQEQVYLDSLQNCIVAIQLDYQGRIWTIWVLTKDEIYWVVQNGLNSWN